MADLRTKTMAALRPAAQTRMDNANVNYEADQALQASTSSEMAKGWTAAGLSEKGNAILDQANNAYRNGDAVTGKALEAEGVRTLEQARVWSPSVQRASDIDGLGSAARWGMGALASGVRSTLPSTAGALVGGALGGLATRSIRGAQLGAGALATVAGYDQMANETIGGAMMDPGIRANKSMQEIKDTGRVSGAVQAPLEALVPGLMGGAAMGLAKGLGRAGVKQAAAAGLAGGAATEAGTEFAQDLVGQGAMNSLRDKPLTQDLDYKQALDSAAAGAVAGGGMGLAGGAMQGLHNRGAGAVDAVGDAVANPGSLLDKGAVLAGDAAGKIMNAAEGVGGKVKGKINSTLDEFIASRVVDPDRHALLAPMTEEESNLSGQELVDRFKPKAQAWASKVLQNPSAYDEEDVADATEFGKTNDPFLLQSKLRNRMGAKAGGKSDEAIADELNPKVKSSKMSAENAEATKKAWDESTRLLAKIWHKQGIDDGIIQAVEGSEDDPIKQNAAVAVMSWVQRGFKGTDGEVIIPEQMIRAYGAKRTGKLIKNAYDLAVGQGVIDDTAEQTFDEVQARVKELGQGHEADVAKVIDNLTPIAREKIVNALSYRDKESAKAHASDLAKEIRSIVQAKAVGDHFGFLHELFGPKMNDVLDHFQPADAEVSSTRDVVAEERADFDADVEEGTGEEFDYDPSINEVEADIDSKAKYVAQSKDNEYFDMHDERHRGRFEEEVGKQSDPDTRVSKVGLVDREIEKIEEEKGRTLPPSERFKVAKRIVEARLARPRPKEVPNLPDNATPEQKKAHEAAMEDYRAEWDEYSKLSAYKPSKLPDGAGPDQTKAHAKSVEDYERRVRSAATQLNKQYKAMRVATEKLAAPRVNFTPEQVNNLHHKNLDHRGPKATIQHGALFFDRGGNKTPYVTSTHAILREMFQVKDGSQESTTEDFGGDAASRMQLLKQGIASLLTGGDFVRVGYVKYAGAKPTWMRSNSRLPGDLTIGRRGEAPITVREAEGQVANRRAMVTATTTKTGFEGKVAIPTKKTPTETKRVSAETKKVLDALPSDPATLGGTQWREVRAESTKEIAFKLGELLKENGANMTKDVRGDIVKATKRFWNLEKRGEVAAGYTAERINAEVDALGLELGFDITTVRTRLEPHTNEPEKIVPSEKSLGMYDSETSRREDDPKTLGPDGKAINRDERGFINSGNATMVAANMAGSESTVVMKAEPKQPIPKPTAKPVVQQDFSIQNVIDNLIRNVGNVVAFVRKSSESGKSVGALLEVLRTIAKMTPGQIRAFDSSLTMNGASRIKVRAENALARIERVGDEPHRSGPDGDVETGAQGEVASVHDEDLRSTDMVTRTAVDPATVRRSRAVAGGAAAGDARPSVKPKTSMVMRFKDGTDFAGIKHVMRDEFRGKSTMDLIMSGDRTATTRNSKPDLQVGDIVTMDDGSGTKVDVRVTKAPYQIKLFGDERDQRNAEKWSQLEGWAPEVFKAYASKGAWQFQYERVVKSSKAKADSKTLTEASPEVQAAKDHILKTVGDKIGLKFIKAFMDGKSGEHRMGPAGQENVIRIALNSDVLGTAYHESIHEFFSMLTSGAATATKEVLLRAGKNKRLLREVSRLLDGHPEAQAQLSDPEEALAYIYQFWKAGALKIGPETKTMFQKVSEYFRNVLGLVSDEMREQQDLLNADKILTAFDQGAYGNETIRAGVMAAVNADVERQDAALKAVGEKWTTIVNKVGKLALPAEQVIEASGNKRLIKILRDFNQKTGDAMDGKASFFEAVSASRNKFMLRLENVMAKADKKDLELARQHLVKGTDPSDPVVTSIVLKTREVLDDLYKFAAERQVARWDSETHEWVGLEYRKGYFTQAWSLDELVKSGPAFKKDLLATHNAELQAIVDRAIKADPKLVVTVDDVAETILSRLLNSQGQVELDETTSDLGISPMASAVNRRSLDWLDKDVFDKYKEKDLVKIMSSYVSTMVKRAEYTDRFGRGGTRLRTAADEAVLEEIGGDELVNEAHTKLPKAIEAWRDQLSRGIEAAMPTLRGVGEVAFAAKKGKDVLEAARTKALKKLGPSFKAVMALEGTLGSDIKQGMRTFNSWMMTYQNVRLLSTSLFTSFSDTVGLVLNGGELGDAWDGFVRGIREIKLRWQDDKSQDLKAIRAEMWGTVDAGSSLDALGQTYGGMWMSGTARRMSDSLFKWNGMEAWNRAMRITATSVAERIIKEFKEKGFDKHDKAAVARFEELFGRGFKPEDIKLDATGELDSTDSKNQAAVSRWVNGAILRPNAAQRTVWGSDPHFQMIWHMKQFTYTFQNVILGKVIEQAKLGNYRPAMVMMAGYTPVIIAADAIKEMLIPGDEPPWMKGGLAGLIQHGVDKAGLLGIGQMGYDAMASDYGAGLTGPAVSQLLHVPIDDPSRTALGALPFGNLARRMAND